METFGDDLQQVMDCLHEITGGNDDYSIKLLAIVAGELLQSQDVDYCSVTGPGFKICIVFSDSED